MALVSFELQCDQLQPEFVGYVVRSEWPPAACSIISLFAEIGSKW